MEHSTPIRSSNDREISETSLNNSMNSELNEADLENLRLVFGSASPEDLKRQKAHELRELWMEKTETMSTSSSVKKKLRIPRFLLDPTNEDHVAPHAVALQLLLGRKGNHKAKNGDGLYKRVSRSDHESRNNSSDERDYAESQINSNSDTKDRKILVATNLGTVWHALMVLIAIVSLVCQFVLEVMGGAGAIWGCAELVRLRKGGTSDPSWDVFSWVALGVGICCFVRFLLVHPFFPKATDPTFAKKYKLPEWMVARHRRVFLELARVVASDPVLFLHPTKGLALIGCCGCYCVCCGNQWSSFGRKDSGNETDNGNRSPASLGKSSPQRSTWSLPDDEFDEFDNAV